MTEEFRAIAGYEDAYEVSNYGRVRSITRTMRCSDGREWQINGKNRAAQHDRFGYETVSLRDRAANIGCFSVFVHRLVAEAFIPNPDNKPEVNHVDGVKDNNYAKNLEWVTRWENMDHAYQVGLIPRLTGSERPHAKLNDDKVREMRAIYKRGGISFEELGRKFGVSSTVAHKATNGITWKHVTPAGREAINP